jgi:hypothetical protein
VERPLIQAADEIVRGFEGYAIVNDEVIAGFEGLSITRGTIPKTGSPTLSYDGDPVVTMGMKF